MQERKACCYVAARLAFSADLRLKLWWCSKSSSLMCLCCRHQRKSRNRGADGGRKGSKAIIAPLICQTIHIPIHPSIFSCLSWAGSQEQKRCSETPWNCPTKSLHWVLGHSWASSSLDILRTSLRGGVQEANTWVLSHLDWPGCWGALLWTLRERPASLQGKIIPAAWIWDFLLSYHDQEIQSFVFGLRFLFTRNVSRQRP